MEKIICSCCGAAIVPNITKAFLTCEYCDTSTSNPYYSEEAAEKAAPPSLEERCIGKLLEIGRDQKLADIDADCFGEPLRAIDAARSGLEISDAHQVYFLYEHTFLFLAFSDGLALTDGGLYYACDSGKGCLSWEAFITGAISCTDYTEEQDGVLKIGSTIELPVKSEKDSKLARFLVDYHNHIYHLYTGETAPASWAVTTPAAASAEAEKDSPSLLDVLLPAAGMLAGTSARRKTVIQRTPAMRPTSRPTAAPDRRSHLEPPRPLHSQPHHRPVSGHPGNPTRPDMGGPGGKPGMGGPGGRPGNSSRPGHPGHPGRPGNPGHPGNPGRPGGRGRR